MLALREKHPAWGGRKIRKRLTVLGHSDVPAPSTVAAILHRYGQIAPEASVRAQHRQHFEHEEPNALWQMDFKGDFRMLRGRCYPLTVVDEHVPAHLSAMSPVFTGPVIPRLVQ